MIQIAVAGAAGRMGQTLISACAAHESFILTHAFEQPAHESVGEPASSSGGGPVIADSIDGAQFDVLIDFFSHKIIKLWQAFLFVRRHYTTKYD